MWRLDLAALPLVLLLLLLLPCWGPRIALVVLGAASQATGDISSCDFVSLYNETVSCASETGQYNRPSRRHRNVSCFQCSWLSEQTVDDERRKEFVKRWKAAYAESEIAIDNPFKPPLLGVETFAQMPTRAQLAAHCNNCSKIDGMCARWTFYGDTGKPANVTWMCVNSRLTGCFLEHVTRHFVKEVCLCADRHHCNVATAAKPASLVAVLLWATWTVASSRVLS